MNRDAKLDIRISSELKQRISIEAERDGRSMAGVIVRAVEAYLSKANNPTRAMQTDRRNGE